MVNFMLTAQTAKETTCMVLHDFQTPELKSIEDGIKSKINLGKFDYSYDGHISKEAKNELERLGYKVTTGSQYNQGWVLIEW